METVDGRGEAIDRRFADDVGSRMAAAGRLLTMTGGDDGREPDWEDTKAAIEDDLDRAARA